MTPLRHKRPTTRKVASLATLPAPTGRFLWDWVTGPYPNQELWLGLFIASDPTKINVPSEFGFTNPTFPGYVRLFHDLWFRSEFTDAKNVLIVSRTAVWVAMKDNACPPILGYWIAGSTSPGLWELIGAEYFDQPQDMTHGGDSLSLEVQIRAYFYLRT